MNPFVVENGPQHKAAYAQVEAFLRKEIEEKRLVWGDRLPPVQQLSALFKTSVFTIQTALAPLIREGLLESSPRRGTFVRFGPPRLTSVGIYCEDDFLKSPWREFYRHLYAELSDILSLDRISCQLWTDPRPKSEQDSIPPQIATAIRKKKVQAFISISTNPQGMKWIEKLEVPVSTMGSSTLPARVSYDTKQMLRISLDMLKKQGCRSVGAILPWPVWGPEETDRIEEIAGTYPVLLEEAANFGLTIRNSWIRTPSGFKTGAEYEEFGYREFLRLWEQPERPDGLFVFPDLIVKGVSTAILQSGVRVPTDLKVVFHRDEGIPYLCPLNATWVVSNPRHYAVALIEQLKHQLAGYTVQPIHIPFSLNPCSPQSPL